MILQPDRPLEPLSTRGGPTRKRNYFDTRLASSKLTNPEKLWVAFRNDEVGGGRGNGASSILAGLQGCQEKFGSLRFSGVRERHRLLPTTEDPLATARTYPKPTATQGSEELQPGAGTNEPSQSDDESTTNILASGAEAATGSLGCSAHGCAIQAL
jgi:hypothetical protein